MAIHPNTSAISEVKIRFVRCDNFATINDLVPLYSQGFGVLSESAFSESVFSEGE